MKKAIITIVVSVLVLAGCVSSQISSGVPTLQNGGIEDIQRSRELTYAVLWMQHTAEYKASALQVYKAATAQVEASLKPGSADLSQRKRPIDEWKDLPTAIIFDLDETLLDNSNYQAWYIRNRGGYNEVTWDQWVADEAALDVPGAVDFANEAVKSIDKVFYVSNRACRKPIDTAEEGKVFALCPQLEHTMKVMKNHKFPFSDDRSVFYLAGMYAALTSKEKIREEIGKRYRIVMLIGDNLRDFVERRADYEWQRSNLELLWGSRWFMIPNPAYGSWPDIFITENDKTEVESACGERPKGPDNWSKTKTWDDCAYSIHYRARFGGLRAWEGP